MVRKCTAVLKLGSKSHYYELLFIVTRLMELTCEALYFKMIGVERSVFYEEYYSDPPVCRRRGEI